jgi:hypothetical protein
MKEKTNVNPQSKMLDALVQNYQFKLPKKGKLPTINYVYPDFTADGNTESFRFCSNLRSELSARADIVRNNLAEKRVAYTSSEQMLLEVDEIAPRLGLSDQIHGRINSIYSYSPLLFVGVQNDDFSAYVVKPLIDASMAWFELTQDELHHVHNNLQHKVQLKPYRNFMQRLFRV